MNTYKFICKACGKKSKIVCVGCEHYDYFTVRCNCGKVLQ